MERKRINGPVFQMIQCTFSCSFNVHQDRFGRCSGNHLAGGGDEAMQDMLCTSENVPAQTKDVLISVKKSTAARAITAWESHRSSRLSLGHSRRANGRCASRVKLCAPSRGAPHRDQGGSPGFRTGRSSDSCVTYLSGARVAPQERLCPGDESRGDVESCKEIASGTEECVRN
jgi:hypothetical protein